MDAVPPLALKASKGQQGKDKEEMLKKISPRRANLADSGSAIRIDRTSKAGPPAASEAQDVPAAAAAAATSTASSKRRGTGLFKRRGADSGGDEEDTSGGSPSPLLQRSSSKGAGSLVRPNGTSTSAPGASSPVSGSISAGHLDYENLVWGQVVVETPDDSTTDKDDGDRKVKRGFGFRKRNSGNLVNSNTPPVEEDNHLPPLPLRRGQIVLVLEPSAKSKVLGYCGGVLGNFDRTAVRVMEGTAAPRCPTGEDEQDWGPLLEVASHHKWLLIRLLLTGLPGSHVAKLVAFCNEALRLQTSGNEKEELLRVLIAHECAQTAEHQLLFRGTTVASRVISSYTKVIGVKYLDSLLRPLIRSTIMSGHEIFEFREAPASGTSTASKGSTPASPSSRSDAEDDDMSLLDFLRTGKPMDEEEVRETSSEEKKRNEENEQTARAVWQSTEMLLESLPQSLKDMPKELWNLAHDMYTICSKKFEDYHLVLSGFLILRFVAPAIAAPESFGIEQHSSLAPIKRRLVHISKVVQAVANRTEFRPGTHLDCLNPQVMAHAEKLKVFYDNFKVRKPEATEPCRNSVEMTTSIADLNPEAVKAFWLLCIQSLPRLAKRVASSEVPEEKRVFGMLVDVLSGLPLSGL